jgi:hypothetical protein
MVTIPLHVSEDLAAQLMPLQSRLPDIIKLGLQHWHEVEPVPHSPRQQIEKLWAEAGLTVSLDPGIANNYPPYRERRTPIQAGGKPASEIIIEQRGPW